MCDHRLKVFLNEYKFQVLTGDIKCFLNSSTSSEIFLWHGWLLHVQRQLLQLFLRRPCHRLILSADSRCLSLQTLPVFVQSFLGASCLEFAIEAFSSWISLWVVRTFSSSSISSFSKRLSHLVFSEISALASRVAFFWLRALHF